MPKISVIIPVYKVATYLNRCIDSVLAQTFQDFDVILVDDGSPDECPQICDTYADKDHRIAVIHKENGGLSDARNAGIDWALENSDSEWITFIDSDDWIHPNYLEILYRAVKDSGLYLSACEFIRISEMEKIPSFTSHENIIIKMTEDYYCDDKVNATVAIGKLYKKKDFFDIRYPKGKLHEDELTTYKVLFRHEQVAYVKKPLYYYFQNSNSIMHSNWTPRNLAQVDGTYAQILYFENNGHKKAAARAARSYLAALGLNLEKAKVVEERDYPHILKQRLRKEIVRYGKQAGIDFWHDSWLYCMAYPTLTLPYRAIKRAIITIRRLKNT